MIEGSIYSYPQPFKHHRLCEDGEQQEGKENKQEQLKGKVVQLGSKRIQKERKYKKCLLGQKPVTPLYYLISEESNFLLNGHYCVYTKSDSVIERNRTRIITEVEIFDSYIQAHLPSIEYSKNFEAPINLLKRRQNVESYQLALQLKVIRELFTKSLESFKIVQKCYSKNKEGLAQLIQKRSNFRKEKIKQYIKDNLKADDFYSIVEFGENFQHQQIDMKSLTMSKPFTALLGVDEQNLSQFFLHVGIPDYVFLTNQETFYGTIFNAYQGSQINQFSRHKDFAFLTLDKLAVQCDIEVAFLDSNYPLDLEYQCTYEGFYLNQISILKFDITPQHIQQVLNYRVNKNMKEEDGLGFSQNIEYQFLAQIFVDKYHSDSLLKDEKQKQEEKDKLKQCGFKEIK